VTPPPARSAGSGPGEWPALSVAVIGAGVSGEAAARTLAELGSDVVVLDSADGKRQQAAAERLAALGVRTRLGGLPEGLPCGADLVVTSPGVRPDTRLLAGSDVPIWGEVELAWRLRPAGQRWLGVTGTNGKTTTTQLLGSVLQAAGVRATTAGNIGTPVLDAVRAIEPYDVLAVELSSFQLHYTSSLELHAAAVLNVADDHLDWHGSREAYAADKARIWNGPGVAVANRDDAATLSLAARARGNRFVTFGLGDVVDGWLTDFAFGGGPMLPRDELALPGEHNVSNALAAALLARAAGIPVQAIRAGLAGLAPGSHRNALVAETGGVSFVDDSKATNPHAAAASLGAYPSVVWVAGGLNKGLAFDELVARAAPRLRAAVLIGTCAGEIAGALARHAPDVPVEQAASMDDAVLRAARVAQPGDTVLLAPAAASMDMFRDYAARGDAFAAAARQLPEGHVMRQ